MKTATIKTILNTETVKENLRNDYDVSNFTTSNYKDYYKKAKKLFDHLKKYYFTFEFRNDYNTNFKDHQAFISTSWLNGFYLPDLNGYTTINNIKYKLQLIAFNNNDEAVAIVAHDEEFYILQEEETKPEPRKEVKIILDSRGCEFDNKYSDIKNYRMLLLSKLSPKQADFKKYNNVIIEFSTNRNQQYIYKTRYNNTKYNYLSEKDPVLHFDISAHDSCGGCWSLLDLHNKIINNKKLEVINIKGNRFIKATLKNVKIIIESVLNVKVKEIEAAQLQESIKDSIIEL